MKDIGIVAIKDLGRPVAVLRRTKDKEMFVGAFCSGTDAEDLTITIFKTTEICDRTSWMPRRPAVMSLRGKLVKLHPLIHKKVKSVFKRLVRIDDENQNKKLSPALNEMVKGLEDGEEWTRSGST